MRATSAKVEITSGLAVGVREMWHIGRGSYSNSVTKAVMDVTSPKARREQTKRRH